MNECTSRRWFDYYQKGLLEHFWLVVLVNLVYTTSANECAPGITTPGWTSPAGDIILEFGQPLTILCMLDKTYVDSKYPGKNASNLSFSRNGDEMEQDYISIVNETTIKLHIERSQPAYDTYYCRLQLDDKSKEEYVPVCMNIIRIGFKPQEPKKFNCTSYNWEKLICTWEPIANYVKTEYSLAFKLPGRAGRGKLYLCPSEEDVCTRRPPNTCLWDDATNPLYRQPYANYSFVLKGDNALGSSRFLYNFHHYGNVVPAKPENLTVVNKTSESVMLYWGVGHPMQNFPPGLHHQITYQDQRTKIWKVINVTNNVHSRQRYFNLTGLEYPNSVYDIRVSMRSAAATGEGKWSDYSVVSVKTLPSRITCATSKHPDGKC